MGDFDNVVFNRRQFLFLSLLKGTVASIVVAHFCRWGNWGVVKCSGLSTVKRPVSNRVGIWTQAHTLNYLGHHICQGICTHSISVASMVVNVSTLALQGSGLIGCQSLWEEWFMRTEWKIKFSLSDGLWLLWGSCRDTKHLLAGEGMPEESARSSQKLELGYNNFQRVPWGHCNPQFSVSLLQMEPRENTPLIIS